MSNFGERLKEMLFENKRTAKELSAAINVTESTVYSWMRGDTQISLLNLIAIADYFQCLIEFLIGRTEDDSKIIPKPCPDFALQVRKVMKEKGFSTYTLRQTTKFDGSYFYKWDRGEKPSLPLLIELSNLFDCTIDYLIGRE